MARIGTQILVFGRLEEKGIKVSMDGKGRWMDNVFIERLWRSVKYEEINLFEHGTLIALSAGLEKWFHRYNEWRPHEALGNETPSSIYHLNPTVPLRKPDKKAACPPESRRNWKGLVVRSTTLHSLLILSNFESKLV